MGAPGDLLEHLGPQDVVAFTGSSDTGAQIRVHAAASSSNSVRVNVEADSLNAAVLGPDVEPRQRDLRLFLKDVVRDMTQKAGQKCTAIRRVLVPAGGRRPRARRPRRAAAARSPSAIPRYEGVRMGPVATAPQLADVRAGVGLLARDGRLVFGSGDVQPVGVPAGKGFFVSPVLIEVEPGAAAPRVHAREVFGPVATLVPYYGQRRRRRRRSSRAGSGGLVSSVYSEDAGVHRPSSCSAWRRTTAASSWAARRSPSCRPGPGTVLPQLVHGGPGRAGGGEELGGLRGLAFYMQRVALEGSRPVIEKIIG